MVASRNSLNESFTPEVLPASDFPEEMPLQARNFSCPWNPVTQIGGWAIIPVYMVDADHNAASFALRDNADGLTQFSLSSAQAEEIFREISELGSSEVIDWNKQQLCDGLGRMPSLDYEPCVTIP